MSSATVRSPVQRVNLDDILDAALRIAATDGAHKVTIAAVARRLRTSIRPVRNRVGDRHHLLARLWEQRSADLLASLLSAALAATSDQPGPLQDALERATSRTLENDAACELLLYARFEPALDQAVQTTLGSLVRRWTVDPDPGRATRAAFVIALVLGLLVGSRHRRAATLDLTNAMRVWSRALTPEAPRTLPTAHAPFIDEYPSLAPSDPALDILLNTALELVALRGFDRVTTAEIAAAAGFTEGLVFSRYSTKLEMITDATARQNAAGVELNRAFVTTLQSEHGAAIAEAVLAREAQLPVPARAVGRSMALEQVRLGWHHRHLSDAQQQTLDEFRADLLTIPGWQDYESETDFFLQFALSWGLYLLPFLNPKVHELPYDAVFVPLYTAFDERCPDVQPAIASGRDS